MSGMDRLTEREWLISLLTIEQEQMLTDYEVHPDAWKGDPERTDCIAALADGILDGLAHRRASQAAPAPQPAVQMPHAWLDVMGERTRQMAVEGWTPEHDDKHEDGQIGFAAACYAVAGAQDDGPGAPLPLYWPWHSAWWKPTDRRRDLVKAGALILAEIERLDRAALSTPKEASHD